MNQADFIADFVEWATWGDCVAVAEQHGHTVLGHNKTSITLFDPDEVEPAVFRDVEAFLVWLGY